jgi:murein DD-endopeptidase MepM/ murein hydrolase activator NlpD
MRSHSWIGVLALAPAVAWAQPSPDAQALLDRAASREKALGEQKTRAEGITREQAFVAYRLSRRQQLAYVGRPDNRVENSQALDAAIVALQRVANETQALDAELKRVRADRIDLTAALSATPAPAPNAAVRFSRPVRGEVVSRPGRRHDADTDTTLSFRGVDVLARLNEPVRAPAEGVVRRVESLPQGGFAVVTGHPGGWVSILSGMRDVAVSEGTAVSAGQPLGRAGRNVDGAAVITVEIWYGRQPVDPLTVVRGLRR